MVWDTQREGEEGSGRSTGERYYYSGHAKVWYWNSDTYCIGFNPGLYPKRGTAVQLPIQTIENKLRFL